MKLTLDSDNIYGEDIANLEEFINTISVEDLLDIEKIIVDERNRRIETTLRERSTQAQEEA